MASRDDVLSELNKQEVVDLFISKVESVSKLIGFRFTGVGALNELVRQTIAIQSKNLGQCHHGDQLSNAFAVICLHYHQVLRIVIQFGYGDRATGSVHRQVRLLLKAILFACLDDVYESLDSTDATCSTILANLLTDAGGTTGDEGATDPTVNGKILPITPTDSLGVATTTVLTEPNLSRIVSSYLNPATGLALAQVLRCRETRKAIYQIVNRQLRADSVKVAAGNLREQKFLSTFDEFNMCLIRHIGSSDSDQLWFLELAHLKELESFEGGDVATFEQDLMRSLVSEQFDQLYQMACQRRYCTVDEADSRVVALAVSKTLFFQALERSYDDFDAKNFEIWGPVIDRNESLRTALVMALMFTSGEGYYQEHVLRLLQAADETGDYEAAVQSIDDWYKELI